jgi:hypothetical protein
LQRLVPVPGGNIHPAALSLDKWFVRRLPSNRLEGLEHRRTLIDDLKAAGKTLLLHPRG